MRLESGFLNKCDIADFFVYVIYYSCRLQSAQLRDQTDPIRTSNENQGKWPLVLLGNFDLKLGDDRWSNNHEICASKFPMLSRGYK